MIYDADFFIEFFSKIPEEKWTTWIFEDNKGRRCALGHCGAGKRNALEAVLHGNTMGINDDPFCYWEHNLNAHTPKTRILAALKLAKEGKL